MENENAKADSKEPKTPKPTDRTHRRELTNTTLGSHFNVQTCFWGMAVFAERLSRFHFPLLRTPHLQNTA